MSFPLAEAASIVTLLLGLSRAAERLADLINDKLRGEPRVASRIQLWVVWGLTIAFVLAVAVSAVITHVWLGGLRPEILAVSVVAAIAALLVPFETRRAVRRLERKTTTLSFQGLEVYVPEVWSADDIERFVRVADESDTSIVDCRSCGNSLTEESYQIFRYRGIPVPWCGTPDCIAQIQERINQAVQLFEDGREIIEDLVGHGPESSNGQ